MIGHHHSRDYIGALEAERRAGRRDFHPLVQSALHGDAAAWNSIVRRFTRRLSGVVRSHRVGAADVDDIVQTTFIRLYENIDSLRDPDALPAWLETTARRETLKTLRAAARERPLEDDVVESLPAPPVVDERVAEEVGAELRRAIEQLPERQRRVLQLLDAPDAPSYEEISQRLRMPVGSIGPTRGRALERLRRDQRLAAAAMDCE
jgi:RNA polymerase sigma factor (sigma-70 family)